MATILKALGIDHQKQYEVSGRPIGIVNTSGMTADPIKELFT